ncbi:uncharacterized protein LOC121727165 [Aricia agestis]|uniref:uncharacterized protein LOC121727165 n=1 Tax=Aricia agestis TaxID=91739 RepID=UPI001C20A2A2|nr:uncharacterized protein LOC121727165 [Aricia agestis]
MLAKLLTLGLVALASAIDDIPFPILRTMGIYPSEHITVASKAQSADLHLFDGPHYYISDGECLGHLDTRYLCGVEKAKGIEVRVSDPRDFPRVRIHQRRGVVHIQRSGRAYNATTRRCPGVALVDLRLSCDHWTFSDSRNRLRLPSILADSSESDSSDSSSSSESDEHEDV